MRLLVILSVFLAALPASAGKRDFIFTWDAETVNKGDLELEQWLWARAFVPPTDTARGWIWFSPVYGLFDHVEIAFPWEVAVTPAGTSLADFAVEGRFRLYDPSNDDLFLHTTIRAMYQQNFANPENAGLVSPYIPWAGLNVIFALGNLHGTHGTIDIGGVTDLHFGAVKMIRQTVGAGMTFKVADEWQLGAEYYHQLQFGGAPITLYEGKSSHQFFAGPDVGFARGRVWATLGCLIGLTDNSPRLVPRFIFGVAL